MVDPSFERNITELEQLYGVPFEELISRIPEGYEFASFAISPDPCIYLSLRRQVIIGDSPLLEPRLILRRVDS
jgi:hypothetical protein